MSDIQSAASFDRFAQIWVVGCGAMGGALLTRWLDQGVAHDAVTIIDPKPTGVPEGFTGRVVADVTEAAAVSAEPSLVVLGIKPQMLLDVAPVVASLIKSRPMVVSMLAGVTTDNLAQLFQGSPIVRVMPNTPARIGRGVTAFYAVQASDTDRAAAQWLGEAAGTALWLDAESQFDAVTAVSGCGPAYLFRFIEALTTAGEHVGLAPEAAAQLALGTVAGAAELAARSSHPPAELRRQVTSPNGVTQVGLEALDGQGALTDLLKATLVAAQARSAEMSGQIAAALEKKA